MGYRKLEQKADKFGKWSILEELESGGQGKVFRVIDTERFNKEELLRKISKYIHILSNAQQAQDENYLKLLYQSILTMIKSEDPIHHGALKVLHKPEESRDWSLAKDRIQREIEAMRKLSHENFIKILDTDPEGKWFISQFYQRGTLFKNKEIYTGDLIKSLHAFRPLVEAVAQMHKLGMIHRDIKPQNVFLDQDGKLILGDFGLIFFADQKHSRISHTFSNVGSRDWMPAWSMGISIKDIKPNFDVFCLGKLLWFMLSKTPILQLWYFNKTNFNLEKMFPDKPEMKWANTLFEKCIVEEEKDCLSDASELLKEVNEILTAVNYHADVIGDEDVRRCKVCGIGNYKLIVNNNINGIQNFGLKPAGTRSFKIFACTYCGNVQFFTSEEGKKPQAWSSK